MAFTPKSDEEAAQAVTRLVDGTLSDAERDEVEAWADASPNIAGQVAAQRRISLRTSSRSPPECRSIVRIPTATARLDRSRRITTCSLPRIRRSATVEGQARTTGLP